MVPKELKIGETWIALAHRRAIRLDNGKEGDEGYQAGIFRLFKPQRIEYIVTGKETKEELEALEARGLTLVHSIPVIDPPPPGKEGKAPKEPKEPKQLEQIPLFNTEPVIPGPSPINQSQ
jgi:hypothetical protein